MKINLTRSSKPFIKIQRDRNSVLIQTIWKVNKTVMSASKALNRQKEVANAMIVSVLEQVPGGGTDI